MEDKQLYTTQEVAEAMNVSDAYIRRLILDGKAYPLQQIGRTWVFTREELDRLLARPKSKGGRPKKQ